jgi:hypothetical protein
MPKIGEHRSLPANALLLVLISIGASLGACEYPDEEPVLTGTSAESSQPAPPPPPMPDPGPAEIQAGNQAQLDIRLGPRPNGLVLGGSGGLASDG